MTVSEAILQEYFAAMDSAILNDRNFDAEEVSVLRYALERYGFRLHEDLIDNEIYYSVKDQDGDSLTFKNSDINVILMMINIYAENFESAFQEMIGKRVTA